MGETKRCTKCKEHKAATRDFFSPCKKARDGLSSWCKRCLTVFRKRNSESVRRYNLLKSKWTPSRRIAEYQSQGGLCAICGKKLKESGHQREGDLAQGDHCHATGKARSLLCCNCNNGLGRFADNPALLLRAALYIISWQIKHASETAKDTS